MSEDDCDYEEEDVISMKSMDENMSCEERSVTIGSVSTDSKNFLDEHYQPLLFGYYDKPKCLRIGDWPALTPVKRDKLKLRQLQIKKANIKYLYENRMIEGIVNLIFNLIISHQPDNVYEFICSYFISNDRESLAEQIDEELHLMERRMLKKDIKRQFY